MPAKKPEEPAGRKTGTGFFWWQWAGFWLSGLLWLSVSLCCLLRPDALAFVTIFPVWLGVYPGLLLSLLAWRRKRQRLFFTGCLLWTGFVLAFAEEPVSLLRGLLPQTGDFAAGRQSGKALRVVSLNCAGGSAEAAAEVAAFQPDIVLLQESPTEKAVRELVKTLYGAEGNCVVGPDDAILTRGRLTVVPLPPRTGHFVQARVTLPDGRELAVVSTRLLTPPFRLDLWNPDGWSVYARHREVQRNQLRQIRKQLDVVPESIPVLVGGDMNAPQHDAIFRVLEPRLQDTFALAGVGWGNTIVNEIPGLRIDQIWVSRTLRPVRVQAYKTQNSDHRLVVCDLLLE